MVPQASLSNVLNVPVAMRLNEIAKFNYQCVVQYLYIAL